MPVFVGGDFYELTKLTAPLGLVSEPANIGRCVAAAKSIVDIPSGRPSPATIRSKCEDLYLAIRKQAVAYLVSAYSAAGEGAENGIEATKSDIDQRFREVQAREFPKEGQLQQYLDQRHWGLSDELFLVKRNFLSEQLVNKLKQRAGGVEATFIKYGTELSALWAAKTLCQPSYIAEGCRGFTPDTTHPSAAILVEEMARWHKKPSPAKA